MSSASFANIESQVVNVSLSTVIVWVQITFEPHQRLENWF